MRELTWFPLLEAYPKTSGWGARVDPITGATSSWHRGVDYAVPYGEPVIAPFDGQVTTGWEEGGAGNWSWVTNGADLFKSFHHSSPAIAGGWVSAGTTIAYIGSTGSSTGAHAHLELWEAGVNIDPTGYLDRAPLYGGGAPLPDEEDVMTDDDFNRIASLTSSIVEDKLHRFLTPNVLAYDAECQWRIGQDAGGHLVREAIRNPDVSAMVRDLSIVANQVIAKNPDGSPGKAVDGIDVDALSEAARRGFYALPIA